MADQAGRPATVVITGASGNLGRAVAARLGAAGTNLVLVARDRSRLDATFPQLTAHVMKIAVDLTDREAAVAALAAAERHFAGIDGLCATAGGFQMGEMVHETPAATWQAMQAVNVTTLLNTLAAVVPGMAARRRGRIVTVGANAALAGLPRMAAYCAAKSAVMRITEALAGELGASGVGANCVLPAIIDTPQNRAAMPKADASRWTAPADIAATIAFLLSAEARAINGALVPVLGH
ncbi:MAG: short-chain dehydrogenase [Alphaproteobacteria bacterium]|nr:MAG: short-chain dehydrogenase [Alphaproteobacteria bacterium]